MNEPVPVVDGADPTRSVMRRVVARIVDDALMAAVVAFAIWITPITFVDHSPAPGVTYWEPEGSTAALLAFVAIPITYWAVNYVVLQGVNGWTIGKFLLSLRTVRFDGRPPGMWRAFVRSFVLALGLGLLGCFYAAFALVMIVITKGHRRAGDFLAQTFVIDANFEGHLVQLTAEGASAGPRSLYASEVSEAVTPSGGDRSLVEAQLRPGDPVFDKARDTYIVWNKAQEQLLEFDKKTKSWKPLR